MQVGLRGWVTGFPQASARIMPESLEGGKDGAA